jgi:hypothetical protein
MPIESYPALRPARKPASDVSVPPNNRTLQVYGTSDSVHARESPQSDAPVVRTAP